MVENIENNTAEWANEKCRFPAALKRRIAKHYVAACIVVLLSLVCVLMLQSAGYLIGLLFAGYLAWLGWNLQRRWVKGEIVAKRMLCLSVRKVPLAKDRLVVVLTDLATTEGAKTFYVPADGKDAAAFAKGMILEVYVESRPGASELIAWQAMDMVQK